MKKNADRKKTYVEPEEQYIAPAKEKPPFQMNPAIVLVIILALFTGYLFLKVQKLEKAGGTVAGTQTQTVGQAATQAQQPQAPQQNLDAIPPVTDKDHIQGSKDASIVMVEYSDFECPFCKQFHPTMQQVMHEYGDKVAFVYRHYPLSFHQNAQKEAEASECIAEQGGNDAFWKYVDDVFTRTTSNGTGFALDQLGPLASELGLDQTAFQTCLDSGKYTKLVQDEEVGGQKTGVQGTPGTILIGKNGKKDFVAGAYPYDQVKAKIDALLKTQ